MRKFAIAVLAAMGLVVAADVAVTAHVYNGVNAGVTVAGVGLEWRGDPGFFVCSDQC